MKVGLGRIGFRADEQGVEHYEVGGRVRFVGERGRIDENVVVAAQVGQFRARRVIEEIAAEKELRKGLSGRVFSQSSTCRGFPD